MCVAMRWQTLFCFLVSLALQAQNPMPVGIARGRLVSWTGTNRSGEITLRADAGLQSCWYDARTYFERASQMIPASALLKGDPLEVLADRKPESGACYARTVQVTGARLTLYVPGVRPPLRSPTESFAPRGDLAIGGRVVARSARRLTLMTRSGSIDLVLRPDTGYASGGLSMDARSLDVNTHVFVRAGRDIYGLIEAYKIMWGDILAPR